MQVHPERITTAHVEHVGDELCIYDWARHVVHALNRAAAAVWQRCDGRTLPAEIAKSMHPELPPADGQVLVSLALRELEHARLLEPSLAHSVAPPGVRRRDVLRRAGITAVLLPVVTSIVAPTPLDAQSGGSPTPGSQTFGFTGGPQTFVVPAGVTRISVDAFGAAGAPGGPGTAGPGFGQAGLGGRVTASLPVTPGESLDIYVGGAGALVTACGIGGFSGGGQGNSVTGGGGGGGASDVRRGSIRLVVAGGGGGGGGNDFVALNGGPGGGLVGGVGGAEPSGAGGGGGGSQTSGGLGGKAGLDGVSGPGLPNFVVSPGGDGAARTGGSGGGSTGSPCAAPVYNAGAGGGGGYFGGGAGGGSTVTLSPHFFFVPVAGGGGGGSSYTDPAATAVVHVAGVQSGSGQVVINW